MPPLTKLPPQHTPTPIVQTSRTVLARDILWGKPIFKAPDLPLPNPRAQFEQLPFTATRITHAAAPAQAPAAP